MSEADEAIHEHLVDRAELTAHGCVADLGCGRGPTLAAFARRFPRARLVGLDHSPAGVDAARELLAGHPGGTDLRVSDLAQPLPLVTGCADAVVSYNVLECLADPAALLREVSRVLRPGGRAVLAHVDFDSLVIAGAPRGLDRRICHAFTDDQQPWMEHADGRIGRKLPGLVAGSPLVVEQVTPLVTASTELTGHAARRIEGVRHALTEAARRGAGPLSRAEIEEWHAAVQGAAAAGRFFFAETAVVVTARVPV
ncbi:methyltransferase domain-containing protein [Kitasatospora sp. A2-31]|uniref:methyltransferase domain-containing protein n=1 Tax=Kitasatospora sp. A2-31 TaxID=2916414 RepID=UPI001EEE6372|nr:methyltransferase domain-containing protein [Kitasatospora sp. A2-31]MCG6498782.1 methyltransferase domain-containing protein [Kitasatospora sp. A2-31]